MENTTNFDSKKEKWTKHHWERDAKKLTQKKVDKFFKKKKKDNEDESSVEEEDNDKEACSKSDAIFGIVNPINTCVGPIGEWQVCPESFPSDPSVILFGKRRTGKTFTLRWILYNCFRHYKFGVVFTRTGINNFWQQYVPECWVYYGLDQHRLNQLIKRQKRAIAEWREANPKYDHDPEAYRNVPELKCFCIMDDVIADKTQIQWNEPLNSFFVEGRHLLISVFINSQHVTGIGPMLRGNADIVILQPIYAKLARTTLCELYAGFMEKDEFFQLMDDVVKDEELEGSTPAHPKKFIRSMVVNDFMNTVDPTKKFKWLVAEEPPPFKLMAKEYWEECKRRQFLKTYNADSGSKTMKMLLLNQQIRIDPNLNNGGLFPRERSAAAMQETWGETIASAARGSAARGLRSERPATNAPPTYY